MHHDGRENDNNPAMHPGSLKAACFTRSFARGIEAVPCFSGKHMKQIMLQLLLEAEGKCKVQAPKLGKSFVHQGFLLR